MLQLSSRIEPEDFPGLSPYYWFGDCGVRDEDDLRSALKEVDSRAAVERFFADGRAALEAEEKPAGDGPRWTVFDCPLSVKEGLRPLPGFLRGRRPDGMRRVDALVVC